jgi:two-component system nitrogen regulation response regulator NtrX
MLTDHFITEYCMNMGKARMEITPEAMEELQAIPWTGNIRELRNVVERLVILCDDVIAADDVKRFTVA